jgi:sugar phosphate isomerase/epimerase
MLDEAKRRMEMAARLGAPYIVATPAREPCDMAVMTRRYKDLLEIGRRVGVRPTFEYISFFRSASRLDQAWQVVQDVADDDATLVLDSFHTWNSGGTLDDLRRIPANKISHFHIDDAAPDKPPKQQTDPDRVMIGEGPIDLKAEVRLLREIGYEGTVSLELFNRDLWAKDPRDVLQVGIQRMRELFHT